MEKLLDGKIALITGGNRGLGKAITEKFVEEGAHVALHYNHNASAAETLKDHYGDSITLFRADLTDINQSAVLFEQVISGLGHVDIVVNNAGVALKSNIFGKQQAWLRNWGITMQVNLNSLALICRLAILHFVDLHLKGRIINIASRAAFRGDTEDYMAYAASKGGVVALTRSIARAFGKKGIIAFTVSPGFVNTDMARQFFDQYGEDYGLKDNALDKLTLPEDVAPMIAFLASGKADHATGSNFDFNAGSYLH